ncbi:MULTISPECIES: CYTH domain-containing protein [Microbulbifer]|uniref:CYTH domain-containing protein n=1 Tax=Microbulbifer TaxID=48073 RepID=UPI001E3EE4D8|nr:MULTISPECIES: CYTH domain-containing protein [Microbulbifer]UHQ55202.1 CYTH domain-containing protein [Microbulbifer sp. YPW16]
MAKEIERKFLVEPGFAATLATREGGTAVSQGYLPVSGTSTVRARIYGDRGFLTLKGATRGISRSEFEYEIPVADAQEIIDTLCGGQVIEKTRHIVTVGQHKWEIDIFSGRNRGLVVAEIELESEAEEFERPDWVTAEVTGDPRYYNANLVDTPYCDW